MAKVIVVGGGPGGYGAALFTAKHGLETLVFDTDETKMHKAYLYNYLGIEAIHGSEFMSIARKQVKHFGAKILNEKVTGITPEGSRFKVETERGQYSGDYLVLATGLSTELLGGLGVKLQGKEVQVDRHGATSAKNIYAVGWLARSQSQAIISAGDGAAAALHLIASEEGKPFHDFDVPTGANG